MTKEKLGSKIFKIIFILIFTFGIISSLLKIGISYKNMNSSWDKIRIEMSNEQYSKSNEEILDLFYTTNYMRENIDSFFWFCLCLTFLVDIASMIVLYKIYKNIKIIKKLKTEESVFNNFN